METSIIRLGDCVICNPSVKLEKGKECPVIDIDKITVGRKFVENKDTVIYNGQGGAKFENGDTLMARITPCLENGKMAQARIDGKGIGSTELFVFRGKEGITDNEFVYYLFKQQHIRDLAANSMSGASGRQRADLKFIKKIKLDLPTLPTQCRIASILSVYDNLIENNKKRIRLLEQMAENLYKEWFVRFRFPGHEKVEMENGLPKGWKYERLDTIASINMGQSPPSSFYNEEQKGLPFHQGVGSYGDIYLKDEIYSTQGAKVAESNSIIFSVRAPVGRINITLNKIYLGRGVAAINSLNENNGFLYWSLRSKFAKEDTIGNGAIFSSVTRDELGRQKMIVPDKSTVAKFESIANKMENLIRDITNQNKSLTRQRDLLLPRLMNGKLEVKE